MRDSNDSASRRRWLGWISGASLGAGMLAHAQKPSDGTAAGTRTYNIADFGAKGDGKTLATLALQTAIDACHKDQGGTVLVPAGVFVIGTVEMKSNVTLHIAAQGKLLGSADGTQYHAAEAIPLQGDTTLNDGNVGLIFAVDAENIAIEGPGTIDGQGAQFRSPTRGAPPPFGRGGAQRPYHILLHRCKNVRIRDIFLVASAFHSIRIIQSGHPENITISNCIIYETYGCPIKMQFGRESRVQNILFSNLVLRDVTEPISINLNDRARRNIPADQQVQTGYRRNILFKGIRGSVVAEGAQTPT